MCLYLYILGECVIYSVCIGDSVLFINSRDSSGYWKCWTYCLFFYCSKDRNTLNPRKPNLKKPNRRRSYDQKAENFWRTKKLYGNAKSYSGSMAKIILVLMCNTLEIGLDDTFYFLPIFLDHISIVYSIYLHISL